VTIVGSVQQQLGELEAVIDRVPWSLPHVYDAIGTYDIGLMPLRDTPYERGKCAYKLLEYGAAGLPSVASPVGANASILGEAGAPAPRTVDDWHQALVELLTASAAERAQLGQRLREVVTAGYSFAEHEPVWRSAVIP
jgi:glycosyltransferase involved in cell wall biosynthesis